MALTWNNMIIMLAILLVPFMLLIRMIMMICRTTSLGMLCLMSMKCLKINLLEIMLVPGLILVGRLSSASTVAAKGYELDLITAVALGGTGMSGGNGGVFGTLLGVAFLAVLNNGLDMVNLPSFYQYLIKGTILVLAVYADKLLAKGNH